MPDLKDYLAPVKSWFYGNPDAAPPSPQSLESQRKTLAAILARRSLPPPTNIGQGINALGAGIADNMRRGQLATAENAYDKMLNKDVKGAPPLPGMPTLPPVGTPARPPAAPAGRPSAALPAERGSMRENPATPVVEAGDAQDTDRQNQDGGVGNAVRAADASSSATPQEAVSAAYQRVLEGGQPPPIPFSGLPGAGPPIWPPPPPYFPDASGEQSASTPDGSQTAPDAASVAELGPEVPPPAAIRLAATGDPPIAAAAANNPRIVSPNITPFPQVAQSSQTPLSPTEQVQLPPASVSIGRNPTAPLKLYSEPIPPRMNETPTKGELYGMNLMLAHPGDENYKSLAAPHIAYGQAQRKADYDQAVKIYERDKTQWDAQQADIRNRPKQEAELLEAQEKSAEAGRQAAMANRMGGLPEAERKAVSENYIKVLKPAAMTIAQGQDAIRQARLALSQGAVTGVGADARINWSRLMGFMGLEDKGNAAANAQLFKSIMQPVVNAQRVAAAGSTNISNADIANAEKAAGANYSLEPRALHELLNILEENGLKALHEYKQNSETLFRTRQHPAYQAVFGAPAFDTEPQKLPAPPRGTRVQVFTSKDATRYPSGTEIILPDGRHGTVP